jgi:hypothetical protein
VPHRTEEHVRVIDRDTRQADVPKFARHAPTSAQACVPRETQTVSADVLRPVNGPSTGQSHQARFVRLRWDCDDDGVHEFTAETAIAAGGWDARYAVVLALAVTNDVAAALIETNGDGADVDLDEYRREPLGGWQAGISSVVNDHGTSRLPNLVAAWGRAEPGELIRFRYRTHQTSKTKSTASH